jgi:hypothetical protein
MNDIDPDKIINDDGWQDMLRRSIQSELHYYGGNHLPHNDSECNGCSLSEVYQASRDVFIYVNKYIGIALHKVLETVTDGSLIEEMLDGFLLLARGGAMHNQLDILDGIMLSLKKFSGLPSSRIQMVSPQRSTALLHFGRYHKGHMATMALFGIYRKFHSIMGSKRLFILSFVYFNIFYLFELMLLEKMILLPSVPLVIDKYRHGMGSDCIDIIIIVANKFIAKVVIDTTTNAPANK